MNNQLKHPGRPTNRESMAQARHLHCQGINQTSIARELRVHKSTVCRWLHPGKQTHKNVKPNWLMTPKDIKYMPLNKLIGTEVYGILNETWSDNLLIAVGELVGIKLLENKEVTYLIGHRLKQECSLVTTTLRELETLIPTAKKIVIKH